jgi:hypothetical protein
MPPPKNVLPHGRLSTASFAITGQENGESLNEAVNGSSSYPAKAMFLLNLMRPAITVQIV